MKVDVANPVLVAKFDPTFRIPQKVVEPVGDRFRNVVVADAVEDAIRSNGELVAIRKFDGAWIERSPPGVEVPIPTWEEIYALSGASVWFAKFPSHVTGAAKETPARSNKDKIISSFFILRILYIETVHYSLL